MYIKLAATLTTRDGLRNKTPTWVLYITYFEYLMLYEGGRNA